MTELWALSWQVRTSLFLIIDREDKCDDISNYDTGSAEATSNSMVFRDLNVWVITRHGL